MTYISVILNKVNHPGLKDYVSRACGKYAYIKKAPHDHDNYIVPTNGQTDQQPMLAQTGTSVGSSLEENLLEEQKRQFLNLLHA